MTRARPRFVPAAADEMLVERYLAYAAAVDGYAATTTAQRRSVLRGFFVWLRTDGCALDEVDVTVLHRFLIAEGQAGASPRTREVAINALRAFLAWYRPDAANPAAAVRPPKAPPPRIRIYAQQEAEAILAVLADGRRLGQRFDHALVATLRFTGIRLAELVGLRLAELDLGRGRARVFGKGSRWRVVPVPEPLACVLDRYLVEVRPQLPDSPWVFANPRATVTSRHTGAVDRQIVNLICQRAAIDRVWPDVG